MKPDKFPVVAIMKGRRQVQKYRLSSSFIQPDQLVLLRDKRDMNSQHDVILSKSNQLNTTRKELEITVRLDMVRQSFLFKHLTAVITAPQTATTMK